MRVLLINPPHTSIGSRMAGEHLPPLGLLSIGGPLIDAGHEVLLLDADFDNLAIEAITSRVLLHNADLVMMGHSGSTSAQPTIEKIADMIKQNLPQTIVIIGGVFPTYHWQEILEECLAIDYIVRGEGEQVVLDLCDALLGNHSLLDCAGIAFRQGGQAVKTSNAPTLGSLDDYRIGWELMGEYNYTYWGKKKAVVIQFSRGCPYPCSYCGQSLFWKKWRNRDPHKLADELEMLHLTYGIEVVNFADENPATNKREWRIFLEALIAKNLNLILVGSVRADNIVRDAAHLDLYKKAGFERFLLGVESYDAVVLEKIKKAGSTTKDMEAIQLLRKHGILSMATYVVGFGDENWGDFYRSLRQLLRYDPDQIQLLYVTPHRWTPYFDEIADRKIMMADQRKWDYKHQVIEISRMRPWQVILCVKTIEVLLQMRPKAIYRWLFNSDRRLRKAMFWYNNIGRRVWIHELYSFFFREKRLKSSVAIREFWRESDNSHHAPAKKGLKVAE